MYTAAAGSRKICLREGQRLKSMALTFSAILTLVLLVLFGFLF